MNNLGKSQLSLYQRERIIHFREEGMNVSEIVHAMEDDGKITSHAIVRKCILHWPTLRSFCYLNFFAPNAHIHFVD